MRVAYICLPFFLILGGAWTVLSRSVAVTVHLLLHRPSLQKSRRRMCYSAAFGVAIEAPGFDPMTRMLVSFGGLSGDHVTHVFELGTLKSIGFL